MPFSFVAPFQEVIADYHDQSAISRQIKWPTERPVDALRYEFEGRPSDLDFLGHINNAKFVLLALLFLAFAFFYTYMYHPHVGISTCFPMQNYWPQRKQNQEEVHSYVRFGFADAHLILQ
jgi:hypothetical protein